MKFSKCVFKPDLILSVLTSLSQQVLHAISYFQRQLYVFFREETMIYNNKFKTAPSTLLS